MGVLVASTAAVRSETAGLRHTPHSPQPRCLDARKAVVHYRAVTWRYQAKRSLAGRAGVSPRARGRSCKWTRYAARTWRKRASASRKAYVHWRAFSYRGSNENVHLGQRMAQSYGWHRGYQWEALYRLWSEESGWDHRKHNYAGSGACGIPQSMTSCFGYSPRAQIGWGLRYIRGRYGSPSVALAAKHAKGWY